MSLAASRSDEPQSRLLYFGFGAALLLALLAAFSGYQQRTFDSYVHMFFADHYVRGWFDLWEPRWYGGFSVVSYPPLAHQLLALFSRAAGLETGFVLLIAVAMLATVLAVRSTATAFVGEKVAPMAVVLAALWPTSHRFAYVYGQLPMIVATPLALFGMSRLDRFLRSGRLRDLALFGALIGATAGAHHVSNIFAAGGCLLVVMRHSLSPWERVRVPLAAEEKRTTRLRSILFRAALAGGLALAAIYFVILPFWKFAATEPQVEIPHISRDPIWLRPFGIDVVEQLLILAVSAGLCIWWLARARFTAALLALGTLVLGVLSLGATTPLPRLLFRSQWQWLTYDKFHHWGSLLLVILIADALVQMGWAKRVTANVLAVVLVPFSLLSVAHKSSDLLQPEFIRDIDPLLSVLRGPDADRFRHLTLGFGDQFCRLDILGRSPNIDGDYHTARRDPLLRQSGIATIDASKYYPAGPNILRQVLARAQAQSLHWVFTYDDWYYPFLFDAKFELKEVWHNGVTLFERAEVDSLPAPTKERRSVWSYLWGLLPLSCLLLALVLAVGAAAPVDPGGSPFAWE